MIDWKNILNNNRVQVNIGSTVNNLKSDSRYSLLDDFSSYAPAIMDSLSQLYGTLNAGQMYTIKYPAGLPHTLMRLTGGGYSTTIVAPGTNNQILGSASLVPVNGVPIMRLMAAASQQYYLAEINDKLASLNEKADSILQFLEVDKRAELVSENAFVQSTIANYDTIMANPEHRIATLTNLQQTKKIAAQHIDFYLFRLKENNEKASGEQSESQARKRYREFERESAYCDAALRLYYICSILEIHLSGNYSTSFIHYIADDIEKRTTDVHDTLTGYCAVLKAAIKHIKPDGIALPGARVAIAPFKKILDDFTARENDLKSSSFEKSILAIETEQSRQVECIVTPDGQAYIKKC